MAAEAGAAVADRGGNAVDAAVAATVVAMITAPGIIAPGAGTFATVWPADADPVVIDGYLTMPGRGLPGEERPFLGERIAMEYGGGMETLIGHASVAVPGAFAGLGRTGAEYGRLGWGEVMAPAVRWAEMGFPMSSVVASYLSYAHEPIFDRCPESRRALHHADGTRCAEGDLVRVEGLARSLGQIAAEGPECLTAGSLGRRLVADMAVNGGRITAADLASYEPIALEPIVVSFGAWRVATNPAPAVGGAALAAMLLLLDADPPDTATSTGARALAEVQRAVLRYRAEHLDAAEDRVAVVDDLLTIASAGDRHRMLASPSTVHTSAVDSNGLACAISTSAGYGSGVMIPDSGMWLNNSLGELELVSAEGRFPEVGERLPSNMAPSLARRDDGAVLAIGSPGASRITTSIAQVLLNFVHRGMTLPEAVEHPRLHVEVLEATPTIACEPGLPVTAFEDGVVRAFPARSMYFGGVEVALWDPASGSYGSTDPRRTGAFAVGGGATR